MTEKEYVKALNKKRKSEYGISLELIYMPEKPYEHPPQSGDNVTYMIPERFLEKC